MQPSAIEAWIDRFIYIRGHLLSWLKRKHPFRFFFPKIYNIYWKTSFWMLWYMCWRTKNNFLMTFNCSYRESHILNGETFFELSSPVNYPCKTDFYVYKFSEVYSLIFYKKKSNAWKMCLASSKNVVSRKTHLKFFFDNLHTIYFPHIALFCRSWWML